jgi:hypothetical protein
MEIYTCKKYFVDNDKFQVFFYKKTKQQKKKKKTPQKTDIYIKISFPSNYILTTAGMSDVSSTMNGMNINATMFPKGFTEK